jgi:BspA type Leucine rich repeat region (6 copies)
MNTQLLPPNRVGLRQPTSNAMRPLLLLLVAMIPVATRAQINYALSDDGTYAYVTNSPDAAGDIIIADIYEGRPVTCIGSKAFFACRNLTGVILSSDITRIEDHAFNLCDKVPAITIPDSVTSIGQGAFQDCYGLTGVTLPNRIKSTGDYVFSGCSGLNSITLPSSLTGIGKGAFQGCYRLGNVSIPNGVTDIGDSAFFECEKFSAIIIPDSVISIGDRAFADCASLTKATLGSGVTRFSPDAFDSCGGLEAIAVDPANAAYVSVDGVVYDKSLHNLIRCPEGKAGEFMIPDSVTVIGDDAFANCDALTSIAIPDSVTVT